MALATSLIVFVVSLLVGAAGIYAGVQLVVDRSVGFINAVITALLGAIVYGVVSFFIGGIPVIGPLLLLLVWIGVINFRYPGGWGTAIGIGLVAWIVALVIMYLLVTVLGIGSLTALGVPGA
ncbi:hypothetical protein BRD01_14190 [Halobacteriales archaeon QS_8_65_32]|jgi:hypothetical protein|nr:MAG: hypothetical protein BRD01_14190 [Halobacteriales archaeon QS_8_65_32]